MESLYKIALSTSIIKYNSAGAGRVCFALINSQHWVQNDERRTSIYSNVVDNMFRNKVTSVKHFKCFFFGNTVLWFSIKHKPVGLEC